ncbi:uncharacterized protein LOC111100541 isoform X1 [Crassostrea virginica]
MMELFAVLAILLVYTVVTVTGQSGGYDCPRFIYKQDIYGFIYKLRTYIYCEHGCCGPHGDYCCTPTTGKPDPKDNSGLYLGVAAGTVVAIVCIISITCCCISKYNKKKVTVGAYSSPQDLRRPHILTVQSMEERGISPPPAYEQTPGPSAPREYAVRFTRNSGKLLTGCPQ